MMTEIHSATALGSSTSVNIEKHFTHVVECIFPTIDVCTEESLYFRRNTGTFYDFGKQILTFEQGGEATFDTYFNSFSVGKFKRYTNIKRLFLLLKGEGLFHISIRLSRYGAAARVLKENTLQINSSSTIDFDFYDQLTDGMLFAKIRCLSATGNISAMSFATDETPQHTVKIGIVVTHFKREKQVMAAIQRLQTGLLNDSRYHDSIQLLVIDNSNTLETEVRERVHVIQNKNYGGSGGFTRGLLKLIDDATFTHCLFMDDDASCEIESIRRTFTFLQFASNENQCIAGALLWENFPFIQFENGAAYEDGIVRPLKARVDLRDAVQVLLNEEEESVDYGAWWFFAFPIRSTRRFSFPFFVRGDDITFSLQNQFDIVTLNGVCCWGESFTHKISAMERYLTMRSTLQMAILNKPGNTSKKAVLRFFIRQIFHDLKTYNYDRAEVMCEAMQDVLKGKSFWTSNVNMDLKRTTLSSIIKNEKVKVLERGHQLPSGVYGIEEGFIRKFIRRLTLNGHLLPDFALKKNVFRLNRFEENMPKHTFRKKEIVYYDPSTRQGYTVVHSKKRFFSILWSCLTGCVNYARNFHSLTHQFASETILQQELFWRNLYSDLES